jgi:hypothetical protein
MTTLAAAIHRMYSRGDGTWRSSPAPEPLEIVTFPMRTMTVSADAVGGGDGTDENPYTFQEALAAAYPGDVLGLKAGVYVGTQTAPNDSAKRYSPAWMTARSGTEDEPIHIVAENFAALSEVSRSELRGGGTVSGEGWPAFGNYGRDHVFWWGFYSDESAEDNKPCEDSGPAVVWSSTGGGVRYCDIRGIDVSWTDNHSGIRLEDAHDVVTQDNYINGFLVNGSGSVNQAGVLTYGCSNCETSYNLIENCGNAIFWKAGTPQYGMKAHHNIFRNCVDVFRIMLLTDTARNEIYQNLFLDYENSAIYFAQTALPNDMPLNLIIANNLIARRSTTSSNIGPFRYDKVEYLTNDNLVRNNLIFDTNGSPVISSEFNTSVEVLLGFVNHDTNCYFNYGASFGGSDAGAGTLRSLSQSDWVTTYGQDENGVFADPELEDPANDDFRLTSGSPCIGAGIDVLQLLGGSASAPVNIGPHVSPSQDEEFGIRLVTQFNRIASPMVRVDFNGLTDGQSVVDTVNDPGSIDGKRWSSVLGGIGEASGFGVEGDTSVHTRLSTSSCRVSIREGSDGDPSGGDTGVGDGAFGGTVDIVPVPQGGELWYGMRCQVPEAFDWNHGSGASKPGFIKFLRVNNSANGQRIEHHVVNGSWDGNAAPDSQQIGWSLANEFDPKSQSETHKVTDKILIPWWWHWIEFYIYAHSDPDQAVRRLWVDGILVFERVGNVNRWRDQNGEYQTEVLSSGEQSLPNALATLTSVMHGTYWNGYSPQDQAYNIELIVAHSSPSEVLAVDNFGNKMMGAQ